MHPTDVSVIWSLINFRNLQVTSDKSTLVSMSTFANSIKFWPLGGILKKIPVLRVVDIKKRKPVVKEGYFFLSIVHFTAVTLSLMFFSCDLKLSILDMYSC